MSEFLLNEVCELIVDCPHTTANDEGKGFPLVRTPNIGKGRLVYDGMHRVCEDVYNKRNARAIPQENDLIFAREATAGNVALIQKGEKVCLGQRTVLIRPNQKMVNPAFLTYFLLAPKQQYNLLSTANGATVAHVNLPTIRNLKIDLPELPTQHRIAAILSRYDSLIENYQKQIKLLEEAAQRLYKEWFVDLHFHFPGHENTKIVDGVPEGWEKKKVEDLLISHMNGGWGKDSSTGSNVIQAPVIRGTDIDKIKGGVFDDLPIRFHTEKEILKKHLEVNDIILELSNGNINNVGRTLRIDNNLIKQYGNRVICASFCKFLRPIDHRISIILFSEFQDMHNGSRMQKFKKNGANGINNFDFQGFLKHIVLVSPASFAIKELEIIQKSISDYRAQIRLLTEARDRLLPKLMSGDIEI